MSRDACLCKLVHLQSLNNICTHVHTAGLAQPAARAAPHAHRCACPSMPRSSTKPLPDNHAAVPALAVSHTHHSSHSTGCSTSDTATAAAAARAAPVLPHSSHSTGCDTSDATADAQRTPSSTPWDCSTRHGYPHTAPRSAGAGRLINSV